MARYERGPIDGVGCKPRGWMGSDEGFGGDGEAEIEEQVELGEQWLAAFGGEDSGPAVVFEGSQRLAEAMVDLAGDLVELG